MFLKSYFSSFWLEKFFNSWLVEWNIFLYLVFPSDFFVYFYLWRVNIKRSRPDEIGYNLIRTKSFLNNFPCRNQNLNFFESSKREITNIWLVKKKNFTRQNENEKIFDSSKRKLKNIPLIYSVAYQEFENSNERKFKNISRRTRIQKYFTQQNEK